MKSIAAILVPQMLTGEARTTKPELVKYTEGLVTAASVQGTEKANAAILGWARKIDKPAKTAGAGTR